MTQPTKPTLTASDPPGWHECRLGDDTVRCPVWWDGYKLWPSPDAMASLDVTLFDDFRRLVYEPTPQPGNEQENAAQFLARVGIDGMKWSEEMHKRFPAIPQDDLLGWCCNMIMAGYDEASRRATPQPGVAELVRGCLEAFEAADNERLTETEEAHREAAKWRDEGDMFGWNFHEGRSAGTVSASIIFFRVKRMLEAALAAVEAADTNP